MKLLLIYLFLINAAGFCFMLTDKQKARKNKRRIPEATLIGIALIGGSFGIMAGMRLLRHKTLHPKFSIGVPLMFAMQVILAIIIYSI